MERAIDPQGKDGRDLRRVTRELVIRLWPLMETSCRTADEAWLARLKEWLGEVRTWPIDSSGSDPEGVDMDPGTRQISRREGR
jgi:hypothetical protein